MLVGPPQTGKRTVIDGLADLMAQEQVPPALNDKRLLSLDLTVLLDHIQTEQGQNLQTALAKIFTEAKESGNVVFVIDNLNDLINPETNGAGFDLAEMSQEIESGNILVVAPAKVMLTPILLKKLTWDKF